MKLHKDGSFKMSTSIREGQKDKLKYFVCKDRDTMGQMAAEAIAKQMEVFLTEQEKVRVIFAAAPSQNEVLHFLSINNKIDWSRIIGFHMDEYLGLKANSDQWFSSYLRKHITDKIEIGKFHFINGMAEPNREAQRYSQLLEEAPIDIVCLGIGENGHIAFNDPPVADFNDSQTMKKVELDQNCRQQQVNDDCFRNIDEVPTHALTLTIPTLMSAKSMVCTVPGVSKAEAINQVLKKSISTDCPATILRTHDNAKLVMDKEAYGG